MDELTKIDIDVASTRPAKGLGIPLEFWVVALAVFAFVAVLLGWQYEIFVFSGVAACWSVIRRDHNAMRVALLWLRGAAFDMHTSDLGGSSVPPFAERVNEFRGMP